jgi:predicted enzyme related to lactoylglutathione lyase
MRIGFTEVYVDDKNKVRAFYSEVLGLQVKDDANYGGTARGLTVVSPEDPDGTQLLLSPMKDAATALQAVRRESGTPALSFTTEDCLRPYQELAARGIAFASESRRMDYAGTDAVFEDGRGNRLNLHQE